MGELSLTNMALELLQINENFCCYVQEPMKTMVSDFELHTFVQVWGSTSGGFEGISGQAITAMYLFLYTLIKKNVWFSLVVDLHMQFLIARNLLMMSGMDN